jgi:hypothetical protein
MAEIWVCTKVSACIWDNKIGTRTGLDLNIKNGYLIKNIKKLKRIIFY